MPKRTFRTSTFETNSSSVHSIVIDMDVAEDVDYGEYVATGGEYGWEKDTYHGIGERLDYIWQAIIDNTTEEDPGEGLCSRIAWEELIRGFLPEARMKVLYEGRFTAGYIDHSEDLGPLLERMFHDPDVLRRFLLGKKSRVETWNDNAYDYDHYGGENFDYPDGVEGVDWEEYIK